MIHLLLIDRMQQHIISDMNCVWTISHSSRMVCHLTDWSTQWHSWCRQMFRTLLSRLTGHLIHLILIPWTALFGALQQLIYRQKTEDVDNLKQVLNSCWGIISRVNRRCYWAVVQTTIIGCLFSWWTHWALFLLILETDFDVNFVSFAENCLSLIHIWRCRRSYACRSRWSPYH